MVVPQALAIGIGAPLVTVFLSGLADPKSMRDPVMMRFLGISALATFTAAALVTYLLPSTAGARVSAAPVSTGYTGMSVSNVGVQLGRYAGGIRYPGQLTGGAGGDGSLIYID
jgi:hypothetical protein